jgi:hypothetical protein
VSDLSEEPVVGCGQLDIGAVPDCPAGSVFARASVFILTVNHGGQTAFKRAQGFPPGLTFRSFLVIEAAPLPLGQRRLGDRDDVQCIVELAAPR